ncbi:hypothetical protein PMZ80_006548 [Knufia obscura]|uniref:Uncharacterized protein n=2 Tax=Knufia TaxID=430999 RepID=A0AAN8EHG3_9EURO|nr:hypothetical protein PMZ80_006548 [Knufia obscura]KAK5950907.1 hypothetical protein OHC33_007979 [Knufia fluminis]
MTSNPTILIVGTLDTKLTEILYLRSAILAQGSCQTKVLDVSRTPQGADSTKEVPEDELIEPLTGHADELSKLSRGDYVDKAIALCTPVVQDLVKKDEIQGIVSAAGSTGSSLATALMQNACPIGFPKLMVSTMASGDIKPYIGETDIAMMYSVVDIAGINSILKQILSNAAGAVCGMTVAHAQQRKEPEATQAKRIAITMFGVTTPAVDNIRKVLTTTPHDVSDYELYVFHATGSGGRAMERLIEEGRIDAVIDLTTTEIADELFGGVLAAGPKRLEAAVRKGIPMVLSTGACDMVNFGPKDTIPEKYKDRNLYIHNPTVTLMRTTKGENRQIGQFIVDKLRATKSPANVRVLLPTGGISMIDKAGQPFHDPEADRELFETITDGLGESKVEVLRSEEHINGEAFAVQVCEQLLDIMGIAPRQYRLANARRRKWSFDHGKTIQAVRRASQIEIPEA